MGVFVGKLTDDSPATPVILTDNGPVVISHDTRDYLVERGRIYLTGYYTDHELGFVFTYKRVHRPVNNRLP